MSIKIKYDGQNCTSTCRKEGCLHEEFWAEHLKRVFGECSFADREKIVKYLSDNDFDDMVREIYEAHYCDYGCWGTGEDENEDGEKINCVCKVEAEISRAVDAAWADREKSVA